MSQVKCKSKSKQYKPKPTQSREDHIYWTIPQVMAEFQVSDRTVRRWLAEGILKGTRVGGVVRIHKEEIEKFKGGR